VQPAPLLFRQRIGFAKSAPDAGGAVCDQERNILEPRLRKLSKTSVQLSSLSAKASSIASKALSPLTSTPITTSMARRSSAGPAPR